MMFNFSFSSIVNLMTITVAPSLREGTLTVRGKTLLSQVPANVSLAPAGPTSVFLGAASDGAPSARHVFSLGVLQGFKLLCLFRPKIWWMIPRVCHSAHDIPLETQMILLEARQGCAVDHISSRHNSLNTFYILMLPLLDGPFRASLQGNSNSNHHLHLCIESGDDSVQTTQATEAVFINSGDNPFKLIKDSIKMLAKSKATFSHIDSKKIPLHLDWFGWCTWDAFYAQVDPQGIKDGLQSFSEGGCYPKFLIIDDGWQDTANEFCKDGEIPAEGKQFATRLVDIKENSKFKQVGQEGSCSDLHELIHLIKEKYGLKFVYMWHAMAGYWGGVLPSSEHMKKYTPELRYPVQSPGNVGNLRDIAMDSLEKYGVGLIDVRKIFEFYDDLHSYLSSCGVDGVKVDVQNLLETLGSGCGGRVSLIMQYQQALERSIKKNFRDNNLICCMNHNSDSLYSSKESATARASEDFMPREPTFQTLHIASVAFNSLLLGEIVVPDWDMFHSKHETAEFHGAARAIGGCAVYVSDKPGNHDFEILKKLVLPDGSVLRARHAGRPTRDCLFKDPVMDGASLLKIWNLNKLTGVIGVFNCQGAGSWPLKPEAVSPCALPVITGSISPLDVEFLEEVAGEKWEGDCAVYAHNSRSLCRLRRMGNLEVSLNTLECEIFTVSPIQVFEGDVQFGAIGLIDMYNSGGAVEGVNCESHGSGCVVKIRVRGCGKFGSYSRSEPKSCKVDAVEVEFTYNHEDNMVKVDIPEEEEGCGTRDIEIVYC